MTLELRTDPGLLSRLRAAAQVTMTPDQVRRQRISFVYGNLPSEDSMTKHDIELALARLDGTAA